jgi:ABC-type phosphate transport system substrate-binding protein
MGAVLVLCWTAPARAGDDIVVVIVGPKSSVKDVSKTDLKNIYLGKRKSWASGDRVIPINLPAKTTIRVLFDRLALDMSPDEVGRYWVGQRIRAQAKPPKAVPSPDLVKKLVASIPGAVGYIPVAALDGSVRAISVDGVDHSAPKYPLQPDDEGEQ